MIKKKIITMILLSAGLLVASTLSGNGGGVPGGYLLEYASDAGELGVGGGSVAGVDNTASIYTNPAGLARLRYMEIMLNYSRLFNEFNMYNGAFGYSFGRYGVLGFGLTGMVSPEAQKFDVFGIPTGENYRDSKNVISISYGKLLIDKIALGLNIKVVTESIDDYFAAGFGFDFGAQFIIRDWMKIGLAWMNVGGPRVTLDSEKDIYSNSLKFGIGSSLLDSTLNINLDVMAEEVIPDKDSYNVDNVIRPIFWDVGAEYWLIPYVSIRAGLNGNAMYNPENDIALRMVTIGAGFKLKRISADYTILINTQEKEFRSSPAHSFTVRYSFGKPVLQKEIELDKKLAEVSNIEKLHKVENLFILGYYQKAYDKASVLKDENPKDKKIQELYERVRKKLSETKTDEMVKTTYSYIAQHKYDDAQKCVSELFKLSPEDSVVIQLKEKLIALGTIDVQLNKLKTLFSQKKYAEMADVIKLIQSVDSTNSDAIAYKAKIQKFLDKRDADTHYRKAYELYHENNDVEGASAELKKALALVPDHKEANVMYKKISAEIKKMYLRKVSKIGADNISVDDDNLKSLVQLSVDEQIQEARKYLSNNQLNLAQSTIEEVIKERPSDTIVLKLKEDIESVIHKNISDNLYNEALRLYNNGELSNAKVIADSAVSIYSSNEKAVRLSKDILEKECENNLVLASAKINSGKREDLELADKLLDSLLVADSTNDHALQMKKKVKVKIMILDANTSIDQGRYEEADRIIQEALKIDPDNEDVKEAFKNIKEVINLFSE